VGGDGAAHGAAELGEEAAHGTAEGVVAVRGAAGGPRPRVAQQRASRPRVAQRETSGPRVAQLVQGPQVA